VSATLRVTIDAVDAEGSASFWEGALGYRRLYVREPYIVLGPPDADPRPEVLIQRVPATDPGKSRVHVDLLVDDVPAEIGRLEKLGAVVEREVDERDLGGSRWTVMSDPQGGVFCVCPSRKDGP
jgi:predicted enzyme related to lactoylglutathione lyase